MRSRRGLLIVTGVFIALIVVANAARTRVLPPTFFNNEQVGLGQSYRLDQRVNDDVVALAETITLESGSTIEGDAALIGSTITVEGHISGSLSALGERLHILPNAQIDGDATLLVGEVVIDGRVAGVVNMRGENLSISPDARLQSDVFACAATLRDNREDAPRVRPCGESPSFEALEEFGASEIHLPPFNISVGSPQSPLTGLLFSVLGSLAISGLAILAVVVFPRQISHIEEAIRLNAPRLGGIGLLLFLLAIGLTFGALVVLAILPPLALVLIPLYLLAALVFFGMALAGWITVTLLCGDLLLRRIGVALPPLMMAVVGNLALVLVFNLLLLTPFSRPLALLGFIALAAVGLGASALTRLGTCPLHKSYLVQG